MNLLMRLLGYIFTRGFINWINNSSDSTIRGITSFLLVILIGSTFLPWYPLGGDSKNSYSILNFILNSSNYYLGGMLLAYILGLVLLFKKGYKFSLLFIILGYAAAWFGILSKDIGFVVYDSVKYGTSANLTGIFFPLFYLVFPVIILVFYLNLVSGERSRKSYITGVNRRQEEYARLGNKRILAFVYWAIFLVPYVFASYYFYNKLLCSSVPNCVLWGSFFEKTGFFWIVGFVMFGVVSIAIGQGTLKGETRVARYLIVPIFILFLIGNYGAYQSFVKTDEQRISSRDFIGSIINVNKPFEISYDQIQGYGINTIIDRSQSNPNPFGYGKCKVNYVYLIEKDGTKLKIAPQGSNDSKFREFLESKQIKLLEPPSCNPV